MAFLGKSKKTLHQHESPEELYLRGALPRTGEAAPSLWLHQGDVVREYAKSHLRTPDLALELPTGTGKTLPGLLIAEWVRRKSEGPVLYATPTKQLASQVQATSQREGIPSVKLVGFARDWSVADESAVGGSEAIGIVTYSTIFNSSPKLPDPRLIVFDDAHAGEQFVGNKYAINIKRAEEEGSYLAVLEALAPSISPLLRQRLEGAPDPGAHHQVRLVLPAITPSVLENLDAALVKLPKPHSYELAMIRSGLESCCVYISYSAIQIRPMIPPTFENRVFSQAAQRIYLSATLGAGGELERAFGRRDIQRMPLPTKSSPRSGRRFFVFPDLVAGGDANGVAKRIVAATDKALVLSQDTVLRTESAAENLAGEDVPVFGKAELDRNGLDTFAEAKTGVLGLANRYDGLDLPGDACRIVVLGGSPDAVGLQERFLSARAGATAVIAERIRTRIVQGAGRCTRGPNDYAVVVVLGADITKYFSRPDNLNQLEPDLQAEIAFGWANSKGAQADEVQENVEVFLEQGKAWREGGETSLAEFRDGAEKSESLLDQALGEAAPIEVDAWELAFKYKWLEASQKLQEAAALLRPEALRGYRGLLLYIAGVWLHMGAHRETERANARGLIRKAGTAAGNRGTWLKEMRELPNAEAEPLAAADILAINAVVARLRGKPRAKRDRADLVEMQAQLAQAASSPYERGLTTLGTFLGAQSHKPKGQGRCDSVWEWGNAVWVTIEAKSEEHSDGLIPLHDVRQANTQLDQVAADRGVDHAPAGSPTILVADRQNVDPQHAPVANPNVYLVSTSVLMDIAADSATAWDRLLATALGLTSESGQKQLVQSVLIENGCLPSQVIDRLTQDRIRPGE